MDTTNAIAPRNVLFITIAPTLISKETKERGLYFTKNATAATIIAAIPSFPRYKNRAKDSLALQREEFGELPHSATKLPFAKKPYFAYEKSAKKSAV